jgi:hypothetical protein
MGESRGQLVGLTLLVVVAVAVDWMSEAVRGLWPSALLIVVGWLFFWRTAQEMEPTFAGPERHRPWLQATGWFFIGAGLLGILLSLLPLL